jgi:hypothetical protein
MDGLKNILQVAGDGHYNNALGVQGKEEHASERKGEKNHKSEDKLSEESHRDKLP